MLRKAHLGFSFGFPPFSSDTCSTGTRASLVGSSPRLWVHDPGDCNTFVAGGQAGRCTMGRRITRQSRLDGVTGAPDSSSANAISTSPAAIATCCLAPLLYEIGFAIT